MPAGMFWVRQGLVATLNKTVSLHSPYGVLDDLAFDCPNCPTFLWRQQYFFTFLGALTWPTNGSKDRLYNEDSLFYCSVP